MLLTIVKYNIFSENLVLEYADVGLRGGRMQKRIELGLQICTLERRTNIYDPKQGLLVTNHHKLGGLKQ